MTETARYFDCSYDTIGSYTKKALEDHPEITKIPRVYRTNGGQFKKGQIPHNKGVAWSDQQKAQWSAYQRWNPRTPWNKGKKGSQIPWNKGTKGLQEAWNKGIGIIVDTPLGHFTSIRNAVKFHNSQGHHIPYPTAYRWAKNGWYGWKVITLDE